MGFVLRLEQRILTAVIIDVDSVDGVDGVFLIILIVLCRLGFSVSCPPVYLVAKFIRNYV